MQQPFAVAGTCTFTAGVITSGSTNLLIFNDNAVASGANNNVTNPSYVNGPVRKIGNDAFTFPVGKTGAGYRLCAISAPANSTDAFTAEFMRASGSALGSITAAGLVRVSGCEYWNINRTTGTSAVNVTLSWSGLSNCNSSVYVDNLATLMLAHFGTSWDSYGANTTSGNASAGTITWNNVSSFSIFSLGSTSASSNPLPVKFTSIRAYKIAAGNKIEWTNATESDIENYQIEKSTDGIVFQRIFTEAPRSNNGQSAGYSRLDDNNTSGTSYYRIKATMISGEIFYSLIVKVQETSAKVDIVLYPNPVSGKQFTLQLSNTFKGAVTMDIFNNNGQKILTKNIQHPGGQLSVTIEMPFSVQPGLYYLQASKDGLFTTKKFMIK